jgi:hypothetical protein
MRGEISFDCLFEDENEPFPCFEGCYRLSPGEDWKVFIVANWSSINAVHLDAVFSSGVTGVSIELRKDQTLSKRIALALMAEALGIEGWTEVRGPDSLVLK